MSILKFGKQFQGDNLVFIVGSPRSGTTWLQRLLASHPRIHTGQESDLFDVYIGPQLKAWHHDLDPKNSGRSAIGLACYFREDEFLTLLREYMLRLLEPMIGHLRLDEIFIEKTPSHAFFVSEILELLPNSRIIHMLRDPRDVIASLLAASKSWGALWAPRHAISAAQFWVKHVNAVRQASVKLARSQFYELRYEDLYACTPETLEDICNFLGLVWDKRGIREAVEINRAEVAKSGGGTPITIGGEFARISGSFLNEPQGFVRRGCPGGWKEDLSLLDKLLVWIVIRLAMEEIGYSWRFPW